MLLLSVNREEKSVSKKVVVHKIPGGDAGCDAQMSSPSHFGSVLVESTQMKVKQ